MNKDTMAKLIERAAVLKQVRDKKLSQKGASLVLDVSVRHVRRLSRRYASEGSYGLIHKNKGRSSSRKIAESTELRVVEWLDQKGSDFGATFAQDKIGSLLGINVSVGTVRNWQIKHGMHIPKRRRIESKFKKRERKHYFGAMVQMDGSPHDWFEGRGEWCTLLTLIDDATGKIACRFEKEETAVGMMRLTIDYINKYGIPLSGYSDRGGVFKVNNNDPKNERKTHFGRALEKLGVELIFAGSPQAKGRVERNHGVHQDRLVKEMRLRNISTIEEANKYLQEEYIADYERRFAVKPVRTEDVHRSAKRFNFDNVFCFEEERTVQNDGTIMFEKNIFQITKNKIYAQPKSVVTVRTHLDDRVTLWLKNIRLEYQTIDERAKKIRVPAKKSNALVVPSQANKNWNAGVFTPYQLKYNYRTASDQTERRVGMNARPSAAEKNF